MTAAAAQPTIVRDEATGTALNLPPGWERVDLPGTQLAIAGPASQAAADGTEFRPNVTVIVAPADPDADVAVLGTQALAGATVVAEDVQVVAYDLALRADGDPGRRLEFAYQAGSVPLAVTQWVYVHAGTVSTVTATCAVALLAWSQPFVDHAVAGLRLSGEDR